MTEISLFELPWFTIVGIISWRLFYTVGSLSCFWFAWELWKLGNKTRMEIQELHKSRVFDMVLEIEREKG